MSWLAEILRKQHRVCGVCGLGPTHLYEPKLSAASGTPDAEPTGTPLCHSCLEARLAAKLAAYQGRCILFEPSLGPDALLFHPLDGSAAAEWPAPHRAAARACLDRISGGCSRCPGTARFAWVPVVADANLWGEDWLARLGDGSLAVESLLCPACAVRQLMRSLEERGLYFEAIVPPRGGDGALFCDEFDPATAL